MSSMKVTVLIHETGNNMEFARRPFYMNDEGDLPQLAEDIEGFISDKYFELNEEV